MLRRGRGRRGAGSPQATPPTDAWVSPPILMQAKACSVLGTSPPETVCLSGWYLSTSCLSAVGGVRWVGSGGWGGVEQAKVPPALVTHKPSLSALVRQLVGRHQGPARHSGLAPSTGWGPGRWGPHSDHLHREDQGQHLQPYPTLPSPGLPPPSSDSQLDHAVTVDLRARDAA